MSPLPLLELQLSSGIRVYGDFGDTHFIPVECIQPFRNQGHPCHKSAKFSRKSENEITQFGFGIQFSAEFGKRRP